MSNKMGLDPKTLPLIKEVLSFLWEELNSEFIATFDGYGWHLITNNFDGIHNPDFECLFKGIRQQFPELKVTFAFIGQKGFDTISDHSVLHGKKVVTVKQ